MHSAGVGLTLSRLKVPGYRGRGGGGGSAQAQLYFEFPKNI